MENLKKAEEILSKYSQEKVLKELMKNKSNELANQVINIDFNKTQGCISKINEQEEYKNEKIENIFCVDEGNLSNDEKKDAINIGQNIISKGKYAVVTMAGGQRNKTWHR